MKAFGLKNSKAKTSAHIMDISFVCEGESVTVVYRQCDYDRIETKSIEEARKVYRSFLNDGYSASAPTYTKITRDRFGRVFAEK